MLYGTWHVQPQLAKYYCKLNQTARLRFADLRVTKIEQGIQTAIEAAINLLMHAPQPLFHDPQVGCLAHEGRSYDLRHRWEKVCIVAEVVKHFLILAQTQVCSGYVDRHDFAIGQLGQGTSFAQALSFRHGWQHFINHTETCDNTVVQVHCFPPQKLAILLRRLGSMNLLFGKYACTSR
jgi:hypothetical protein